MAKVLVVEDDPGTADIYARILKVDGYDVLTALDAESGLRLAMDGADFDAMIVDLRMPFMDGLSFLRLLRESPRLQDMPVGIVTGDYFVSESTAGELKRLGSLIRFKPLWADDLLELTHTLIHGSSVASV